MLVIFQRLHMLGASLRLAAGIVLIFMSKVGYCLT